MPTMKAHSRSCIDLNRIDEDEHDESSNILSSSYEVSSLYLNKGEERLVLPQKGSNTKLDEYLKSSVPRVASRADELTMETDCAESRGLYDPVVLNSQRCLNVLQGEVAHVSAEQADVVVSAEATTCHIVALRSTKSESIPLVSLAHVDQVYDQCLENMVKEHIDHHLQSLGMQPSSAAATAAEEEDDEMFGFFMDDDDDDVEANGSDIQQPEQSTRSYLPTMMQAFDDRTTKRKATSMPDLHVIPTDDEPIEMELHMVGGYLDKQGTSQKLSTALLERFDDLAFKYQDRVKISLSTAAISSLNTEIEQDNQQHKPLSRGLGIDTRTGEVFPVKKSLPAHLEGPAIEVRQARAFATDGDVAESLSVIHDKMSIDGEIRIEPFRYQQQQELNVLLNVPDDVLLSVTSTSPDHESDQFCTNFRRTLSFVNSVPSESVFENNQPLVYKRSSDNLNYWQAKQRLRQQQSVVPTMKH